jgi:tetratricopeptide (TPR) repeat protein
MISRDPAGERHLPGFWVGTLVFCATFAAYFPALRGGLVWDDDFHVTKESLRPMRGLVRIWFEPGATAQYYPVLHSAFWVEHRIWGDSVAGYHLVNVLLHATSACLFIGILRRLKVPGAWFGGLLFALHPVCVESVAWISEQKNTLSTVFYLLAALAFLKWREETDSRTARPRLYFLAFALYALALLSKSVTATLPAALLVIAWWRRGRLEPRRDLLPLLPWFAIGLADGLFTAWMERHFIGAQGPDYTLGPVARVLVAGHALWFYFGKLLWPSDLIFIYPHWTIDTGDFGQILYPLAALGVFAALWAIRRRTRAPLAIALLFAGSLFPALGFINVYPFVFSYVADHFQYLACLGIFAAAAGAWGQWEKAAEKIPYIAAAVLLAVLGLLTWRQSRDYRDARTLYEATLARNPACWMAETNLGILYSGDGKPDAAIAEYEKALRIKSDLPETRMDLGNALRATGRNADALAQYDMALGIRPGYAPAHYNRGVVLAELRRLGEAIGEYREAIRLNPDYAEAHDNLGNALRDSGRLAEALPEYQRALRLDPGAAEFHNNLGVALAEGGRLPEAIGEIQQAVQLRPRYAQAEDNLGKALSQAGRADEALRAFQAAAEFAPDRPEAHYDLAIFLARAGRIPEAIAELRESVRLMPGFPEGHNNLGNALRAAGRTDEAIAEYRQAIQLRPDYREAHYNLALALQAEGRAQEAQEELAKAGAAAPGP